MASFLTGHKHPYDALTRATCAQPLTGKSILVTGASRGVGECITRQIAAAGAQRIAILDRDKARIEDSKKRFSEEFPNTAFVAFAADITDEKATEAVFLSFGAPDVLVNNAGYFPDDGPFVEQNLKAWFSGFEINVFGTAVVTQKFLLAKTPEKRAVVLNVSSAAAHMRVPLVGCSGYTSSKLAQTRMFEYIRFEHPEVRFASVHPGSVETDGFRRAGIPGPPSGMTDGEMADFLNGRFVWAEWDIDELKARKEEIIQQDLLLTTFDGFVNGF
ncbi:hypothetical protein EDB80DRAFT_751391 [Ilyonectria destructans]|nr:hypothetical protein EDB80DRAFT_751391 [Ilyonectria destructans]